MASHTSGSQRRSAPETSASNVQVISERALSVTGIRIRDVNVSVQQNGDDVESWIAENEPCLAQENQMSTAPSFPCPGTVLWAIDTELERDVFRSGAAGK